MVSLKFRNQNQVPIRQIGAAVIAALKGPYSPLVIINQQSQTPPIISIDTLNAIEDRVKLAQLLTGKLPIGVVLESIE